MARFGADATVLPDVFPVFPLEGVLLLPGGRLPLNIFEPRYLALTEDALSAGRVFGMVQPDPTRAEGSNGPALYRVGCLGRLVSFSETEDGRFMITLLGISRFRFSGEATMRRGYRRAEADFQPFAQDMAPAVAEFERVGLVAALRGFFARRGIEADWDAIRRMDDGTLVTTLSMVCPFAPAEKQALLEAPTGSERAAMLLTLLRMDEHDRDRDGARGPAS